MTITSTGYDGTLDERKWAKLAPFVGVDTAVADTSLDDWRVSVEPGTDRTVRVRRGTGYGWGVVDTADVGELVQLPVVASGSRWDTIVARRDWRTTPGGTTTFTYVQGGADKRVADGLEITPGTVADQPLALARVTAGVQEVAEVVDLRRRIRRAVLVCASATRPGLLGTTAPQVGEEIYETDTGRRQVWTGTAWLPVLDPDQHGDYRSYTPGISGYTLGSGSRTGQWQRIGPRTVHAKARVVTGAGATFSATRFQVGLPVNAAAGGSALLAQGTALLISAGGARVFGWCRQANESAGAANVWLADGSYAQAGTPWVWQAGDSLEIDLVYRTAV